MHFLVLADSGVASGQASVPAVSFVAGCDRRLEGGGPGRPLVSDRGLVSELLAISLSIRVLAPALGKADDREKMTACLTAL